MRRPSGCFAAPAAPGGPGGRKPPPAAAPGRGGGGEGAGRRAAVAPVVVRGGALASPAAGGMSVEAHLSAGRIEAGGTVSLLITVSDPRGSVADPQFALPSGLAPLRGGRSQQFS